MQYSYFFDKPQFELYAIVTIVIHTKKIYSRTFYDNI